MHHPTVVTLIIIAGLLASGWASSIAGGRVVAMRLTTKQHEFLVSPVKAVVFCGGVGSGKTYIGSRFAYRMVMECPKALGLITANSYKQLAQSTVREFKKFLDAERVPYVFGKEPPWFTSRFKGQNAHANVFSFPNGAQIVCRSLDNYDDLRGAEYGWWWGDETRDTKREAYDVVLGRLRDPHGPGLIRLTTTPNGYDWLYEVFEEEPATEPQYRTQRKLIVASTYENRANLPDGYIETMEANYDPTLARQEIYGEFIAIGVGTVYATFNRNVNVQGEDFTKWRKRDELILGCDFNPTWCAWVVCQRREINNRECLVVIDEIVKEYTTPDMTMTEAMTRQFLDRYAKQKERIVIYGDYYGHTAKSNATKTDWQIVVDTLRAAFPGQPWMVDFRVPKIDESDPETKGGNPAVIDRTNAVNAKFRDMKQRVSCYVAPKCKALTRDFERVVWKQTATGRREIDKTADKKLTHASDSFGYVVMGTRQWNQPIYGSTGPQYEMGEQDEADRILDGAEPR